MLLMYVNINNHIYQVISTKNKQNKIKLKITVTCRAKLKIIFFFKNCFFKKNEKKRLLSVKLPT